MKHGPSRPLTIVVALLILSPGLYVLSTGPAIWLTYHGHVDPHWFEVLYRPAEFIVPKWEIVDRSYLWYLSLWVDLPTC